MTTESVTNYSIYCETESATVTGWGTAPPEVCYNNSEHTVDTEQITSIETVMNMNSIATAAVYNYKIYCITEEEYVSGWGKVEPTACYNNPAHSVNPYSVQLIEVVNNTEVVIKEDNVQISRNFKVITIEFSNVMPNTSQSQYYTFDIVTSMYSFKFATDDTNKGDTLSISANNDTPLGLITANVTAGDTTIHAPAALFVYGKVGYYVMITDGTNTDQLGYIKSIDPVAGTIVVKTAATHNFSSTNTLLKMTLYTLKDLKIGPPQMYNFANDIIGGTAVPVNTTVKFTYTNNASEEVLEDIPKSLVIYLDILY